MQFYGRGRVAHGRPAHARALAQWREVVGVAARDAMGMGGHSPFDGPCGVEVVFRLARPLVHHRGRRRSHPVRPDAPSLNTAKPDVDKLVRALLDSLTSVCWRDDAQVARVTAQKLYAPPGEPGATVAVWALVEVRTEPERETVTLTLDGEETLP